jgi:hypothetical protein
MRHAVSEGVEQDHSSPNQLHSKMKINLIFHQLGSKTSVVHELFYITIYVDTQLLDA